MSALYSKLTVNGVDYRNDVIEILVTKSVGDVFSTSKFTARLNNLDGKYKDSFTVGQSVDIHLDTNSSPDNKVFSGFLERVDPESVGTADTITLSGRDHTARLMEITVLESYASTEASAIVTDLYNKYLAVFGFTNTNVKTTGKTISNITFKRKPLFEAIKEVARMVHYTFFVDEEKDLHFEAPGGTDSGITLDTNNTTQASFITATGELYNNVWVYGGRYLSGWQQSFTANGAGSVFTLDYKPHDALVFVSGAIRRGGIFEVGINSLGSATQYLVDYDTRNIIFVSGTLQGDNIPGSLVTVRVDYQRQLPIIKFAQDEASTATYGQYDEYISNDEITDPNHALDIAKSVLAEHKNPSRNGVLEVVSSTISELPLGQLVTVNMPVQNVNNEQLTIVGVDYRITKDSLLGAQVITARVDRRVRDTEDIIASLQQQIQELQAKNIDTSDIISRLQVSTGSYTIWHHQDIWTRAIQDSFILSNPPNATLGTTAVFGDRRAGSILNRRQWRDNTYVENFIGSKFKDGTVTTLQWDLSSRTLHL